VTQRELQDQLSNSPFMVMAYVLARLAHADDWTTGVAIGAEQSLEYQLIFPKSVLADRYSNRQDSRIINQVANLVFLTSKSGSKRPSEYLANVPESRLQAQRIPLDPSLWSPDRFEDFVSTRRQMFADGINELLRSLSGDQRLWSVNDLPVVEARINALEQQCRDLVALRLTADWGTSAWKKCVPGDIQDRVKQRVEQQIRQKPYEADEYNSLSAKLGQCQFSDYQQIIMVNWDRFQDAFGTKPQAQQYFSTVINSRNALKHGRSLNQGELATTEGALYWFEQCLNHAIESDNELEETGSQSSEEQILVS